MKCVIDAEKRWVNERLGIKTQLPRLTCEDSTFTKVENHVTSLQVQMIHVWRWHSILSHSIVLFVIRFFRIWIAVTQRINDTLNWVRMRLALCMRHPRSDNCILYLNKLITLETPKRTVVLLGVGCAPLVFNSFIYLSINIYLYLYVYLHWIDLIYIIHLSISMNDIGDIDQNSCSFSKSTWSNYRIQLTFEFKTCQRSE